MAYKSILSFLTEKSLADVTLKHLVTQAEHWDASADVLCLGVDGTQSGYFYTSAFTGANAMILQESITKANSEAAAMRKLANDVLSKANIRFTAETGVAQLSDLGRAVASRARYSDLVVLPKPYGENRGLDAEALVESALFEGRAPVLVVPDEDKSTIPPKTVLLAWNESNEALAAARAAMPFLMAANTVRIVVIDPDPHSPERSDPGGMLAQLLARHGVKCEIDVLGRSLPKVSDVLLRHVTDTDADMVVMGAYGHSRLREALLGGATREMLEAIPVQVLMAR